MDATKNLSKFLIIFIDEKFEEKINNFLQVQNSPISNAEESIPPIRLWKMILILTDFVVWSHRCAMHSGITPSTYVTSLYGLCCR